MGLLDTETWIAEENERFYEELDAIHVDPESIEVAAPEA